MSREQWCDSPFYETRKFEKPNRVVIQVGGHMVLFRQPKSGLDPRRRGHLDNQLLARNQLIYVVDRVRVDLRLVHSRSPVSFRQTELEVTGRQLLG